MFNTPVSSLPLTTVARLAELITGFHVFIYFCPEAVEEYEKAGVTGWGGYFGSRTAAMGELSTEMVIATFYNFSPDRVVPSMEGVWEASSAEALQAARWEAARRVLEAKVAPVVSSAEVSEALQLMERAVNGLRWEGRPMAAGNFSVLKDCPDNDLVRLWQLATILREWRGDAHIGVLIAEPLSGVECSVVTHAQSGADGFVRRSRRWSDEEWDVALGSLVDRGLLAAEDSLTEAGTEWRAGIEQRTNELSAEMWVNHSEAEANRLGDLLEKMVAGLR